MRGFFLSIKALSSYMYWVSGLALVCLMLLTVSDVILRVFNRPIAGVYDLTLLLAGIVIGFAIPFSTWKRAHVRMLFLIEKVRSAWRKIFLTVSYVLGIFVFLIVGRGLLLYGMRIYQTGEVSMTIHLPIYPVVFGMGASCLLNTVVLFRHLVGVFKTGEADES